MLTYENAGDLTAGHKPQACGSKKNACGSSGNKEDDAAKEAIEKSATGWYHFLFANCAQAVQEALAKTSIDPGYDDEDAPTPIMGDEGDMIKVVPAEVFDRIIKNNKERLEKEKKEEENKNKGKVTKAFLNNVNNMAPGTYTWNGEAWVQQN